MEGGFLVLAGFFRGCGSSVCCKQHVEGSLLWLLCSWPWFSGDLCWLRAVQCWDSSLGCCLVRQAGAKARTLALLRVFEIELQPEYHTLGLLNRT